MLSLLVVLVEAAASRSEVHLTTRVLIVTHLVLVRSWRSSLLRKVRSFLALVRVEGRFLAATTKSTSVVGVISLDQRIKIAVELFWPHSLLVHVVRVWRTTISLLLIIIAALVVASTKLLSCLRHETHSVIKARLVHHLAKASLLEFSCVELIVVGFIHWSLTLTLRVHLSSSHHELRRLLSLALTLVLRVWSSAHLTLTLTTKLVLMTSHVLLIVVVSHATSAAHVASGSTSMASTHATTSSIVKLLLLLLGHVIVVSTATRHLPLRLMTESLLFASLKVVTRLLLIISKPVVVLTEGLLLGLVMLLLLLLLSMRVHLLLVVQVLLAAHPTNTIRIILRVTVIGLDLTRVISDVTHRCLLLMLL